MGSVAVVAEWISKSRPNLLHEFPDLLIRSLAFEWHNCSSSLILVIALLKNMPVMFTNYNSCNWHMLSRLCGWLEYPRRVYNWSWHSWLEKNKRPTQGLHALTGHCLALSLWWNIQAAISQTCFSGNPTPKTVPLEGLYPFWETAFPRSQAKPILTLCLKVTFTSPNPLWPVRWQSN